MAVPTVPVAPGRDHHRPAGDRGPAGIDAASAPGAGSLATGSIFNRRFGASACKPRIACSTWNTLPAGQALGDVSRRILHWESPGASLDPTVERGQSMAHEIARRLGDIAGNASGFVRKTVAFRTQRNDPVVVGPHRAKLVRVRIVSGIASGECANTPATPHIRFKKALYNLRRVLARDVSCHCMVQWR